MSGNKICPFSSAFWANIFETSFPCFWFKSKTSYKFYNFSWEIKLHQIEYPQHRYARDKKLQVWLDYRWIKVIIFCYYRNYFHRNGEKEYAKICHLILSNISIISKQIKIWEKLSAQFTYLFLPICSLLTHFYPQYQLFNVQHITLWLLTGHSWNFPNGRLQCVFWL